jgi:hypothetical protein
MLSIGLWLIWIPCGSESVFLGLRRGFFLACGVGFFVVVFLTVCFGVLAFP